jgi:alkylhydroperoxidase/carboxymuconolactone decarboxylase family protein YurZ
MNTTPRTGRRQLMAQGGEAALAAAALQGALARTAAQEATPAQGRENGMVTDGDLRAVSPALARYRQETLFGDLWNRPALSSRDRGIVTLAALITRNQTIELPSYVSLPASLYRAFPPAEAKRLAANRKIPSTPKHGSWLNHRRDRGARARARVSTGGGATAPGWSGRWPPGTRHTAATTGDGPIATEDARRKRKRLYPVLHA